MVNKSSQIQVEVRRRESESPVSLMRRFSKKVQQAGLVKRVRAIRFRERSKTKRQMREMAIRRKKRFEEKQLLKKLGKIKAK